MCMGSCPSGRRVLARGSPHSLPLEQHKPYVLLCFSADQRVSQGKGSGGEEEGDRGLVVVGASVVPLTLAQRQELGAWLMSGCFTVDAAVCGCSSGPGAASGAGCVVDVCGCLS